MLAGGEDRVYAQVAGEGVSELYALSVADGSTEWHEEVPGEPAGRPVVAEGALLVRTDWALRCYDPAEGTERWRRAAGDVGARVIIADNLVFATGGGPVRALRPP